MSISVICPGCSRSYQVAAQHAGKHAKCQHCGSAILIPHGTPSAVPHEAPQPRATVQPGQSKPPPPPARIAQPQAASLKLFVAKDGQQQGPHTVEHVAHLVLSGTLDLSDFGWDEGLNDWVPLNKIPDLPETIVRVVDARQAKSGGNPPPVAPTISGSGAVPQPSLAARSGKLEGEKRILDQTGEQLWELLNKLSETESDDYRAAHKVAQQKVDLFRRQIDSFKNEFQDTELSNPYECNYHFCRARLKLSAHEYYKVISQESWGTQLGMSMFAERLEKPTLNEIHGILDKAVSFEDRPRLHMLKSWLFRDQGNIKAAKWELNYVISNFPEDEDYFTARQELDEIEASGGR